jgi:hypothetical protein
VAPEGAYARIVCWNSREHWLTWVVPAAVRVHRAVLRRYEISADTFKTWALVKSGYATASTGRKCIVRPETVASVMGVTPRHVERCNAAAREMGLEVVVLEGRMLTLAERMPLVGRTCQRGLATEVALTYPQAIRRFVDSVTPHGGSQVCSPSGIPAGLPRATAAASGQEPEAASRPPHRRERRRPRFDPRAVHLAAELASSVAWLAGERPGRLAPALTRFARCEPAWTAPDLAAAIGAQLRRAGRTWIDPEQITTRPAAVLAGILRQLDEHADNPAHADQWADVDPAAAAIELEPCGGRDCDGHGWITPPRGSTDPVRPCPECPPAVRSARHRPGDWSAGDGAEPPF